MLDAFSSMDKMKNMLKFLSKSQDNEWTKILPTSLPVHFSEATLRTNEHETPLSKLFTLKYGRNLSHRDIFSVRYVKNGCIAWMHVCVYTCVYASLHLTVSYLSWRMKTAGDG